MTEIWDDSWFAELLGAADIVEGAEILTRGKSLVIRGGIPRARELHSVEQEQTRETFAYIWHDSERFSSPDSQRKLGDWYAENYGPVAQASWWGDYTDPLLLEAGCGSGLSGTLTFGERLRKVRYLGVDISTAVDAAKKRFDALSLSGQFLQADLTDLPIPDSSVDVIYSQGVLHHTDSTETAIEALSKKLKVGGRFLFYVYSRKGPIREHVDDLLRAKLAGLRPEEAWQMMAPLTELGKALAELDTVVEVPEDIDLLEIPAGPISLQRLFYWHVAKAYFDPALTFEELNQINLDWYAPANATRHTVDEIRQWCGQANLDIEREHVQPSGLSYIARKRS